MSVRVNFDDRRNLYRELKNILKSSRYYFISLTFNKITRTDKEKQFFNINNKTSLTPVYPLNLIESLKIQIKPLCQFE